MNKRKIFILLVVLFAVLGISLSAVSAATTTVKLDKGCQAGIKLVGKTYPRDVIQIFSYKKTFVINIIPNGDITTKHKLTKAKVFFKNKKGKKITKTYKFTNKKRLSRKNPKKGYTAYKAIVTYYRK